MLTGPSTTELLHCPFTNHNYILWHLRLLFFFNQLNLKETAYQDGVYITNDDDIFTELNNQPI